MLEYQVFNKSGLMNMYNHRNPIRNDAGWIKTMDIQASLTAIRPMSMGDSQNNPLRTDSNLEIWASTLVLPDLQTELHSLRVSEMAVSLAQAVGIHDQDLYEIRQGALLHDIGKIEIPDEILFKPGKLTDEEWGIMRKHPMYAYNILSQVPALRASAEIPYYHHERWDGTGYPNGLCGPRIPLAARILAIIDVWDALNSDRPYRKAWSQDKVIQHMQNLSGSHFDPQLADIFFQYI